MARVYDRYLRMQVLPRFSYTFGSGWPGLGLLVMRVAVASGAASISFRVLRALDVTQALPWVLVAGALVVLCASLSLCIGLFSPYAELTLTIASVSILGLHSTSAADAILAAQPWPLVLMMCGVAVGLALIGPGAYSVDAKLSGRYELTIPPNRVGERSTP